MSPTCPLIISTLFIMKHEITIWDLMISRKVIANSLGTEQIQNPMNNRFSSFNFLVFSLYFLLSSRFHYLHPQSPVGLLLFSAQGHIYWASTTRLLVLCSACLFLSGEWAKNRELGSLGTPEWCYSAHQSSIRRIKNLNSYKLQPSTYNQLISESENITILHQNLNE